ncbi:MAG TPA: hypothetical protein VNR87_07150 [Flavisolibacter sp.]|nr:hypothetical protein [Flavisolibacter sp.]
MRRLLTILLFGLFAEHGLAQQDSSFVLVRSIEAPIADAAMDNFGNLYIISPSGQIKKLNDSGDSVAVYNQVNKFGKLYSIDVSNPLKVLLFYKDFSTVVVLDRFLSNLATMNLRKYNILQPGAVALSYDNNVWVYDEYDNKLKKIDEQGNHLLETSDFRTVFNRSILPQKIINDNGLVYLADSANGVFIFDNYGSFKKKLDVKNWQSIAIASNNLISTNNEIISVYNTSTLMQTQRKWPYFKPYYRSFTSADKFVHFSNSRLQVYRYRF